MSEQSRYAVPLEQLEAERVRATAEVQPLPPHAGALTTPQVHRFGDGMADADGD